MPTPPDFSTGAVLTAAQMDQIGLWRVTPTGATNGTVNADGTVTIGNAVASVTVTGCFGSSFDSYKILVNGGTATGTINMRFQLGASTTGYYDGLTYVRTDTPTTARADGSDNTLAYWDRMGIVDPNGIQCSIEIHNPGLAKYTTAQALYAFVAAGDAYIGTNTAIHTVATAYTSFTFSLPSGNITGGTITIYGYN